MKQLKCIAIDDEPLALEIIKRYVSEFPFLQLSGVFDDAITAAEYLKLNKIDLLFIDIDMPDVTGIDLVRSLETRPMVIFTTAYKNFAFEGFELEAVDYLLKPIDFRRFEAAVQKALNFERIKTEEKAANGDSIFVHSEYKVIKIMLADIEYIESMQDYVKIYLTGAEKPVLTLSPLKSMIEKLPSNAFIRIHRSFVVAADKVRSVHSKKVQVGDALLPAISVAQASMWLPS
jgi:DNA-binding LytR/AlgR family response regulator